MRGRALCPEWTADKPSICHCRMCQKAFGSFFAPLVAVRRSDFELTRGELSIFKSSDAVERGFCRDCGTPLSFRYLDSGKIDVSIGSLDDPSAAKPVVQYGMEARLPWLDELASLPGRTTEEDDPPALTKLIRRHQSSAPRSRYANAGRRGRRDERFSRAPRPLSAASSRSTPACSTSATAISIYWETCGTPGGKPAVFLHGGPGGGFSPDHRRLFDPGALSTSCCSTSAAAAARRRMPTSRPTRPGIWSPISSGCASMMGVDKWLVFGGSWGSTLALAYAETHPERVSELVLRGIFTLRRFELDWYYQHGVSEMFPDKWERFLAPIPEAERGDLMAAYRKPPDQRRPRRAARGRPGVEPLGRRDDHAAARSADQRPVRRGRLRARLRPHREPLLRPCRLAGGGPAAARRRQARRTFPASSSRAATTCACPADTPGSCTRPGRRRSSTSIEGAGHAYSEPGILDQLIRATDRFAGGIHDRREPEIR